VTVDVEEGSEDTIRALAADLGEEDAFGLRDRASGALTWLVQAHRRRTARTGRHARAHYLRTALEREKLGVAWADGERLDDLRVRRVVNVWGVGHARCASPARRWSLEARADPATNAAPAHPPARPRVRKALPRIRPLKRTTPLARVPMSAASAAKEPRCWGADAGVRPAGGSRPGALVPRSLGGCDHADCVAALCRPPPRL
jgi:hypothetical protein